MTDIATKRETFRAAVEVLVNRALQHGQPRNPRRYAAAIRHDLLNDHRDRARDLLDTDPTLTAEALADMLEPEPEPTPSPTSALATFHAEPWTPPTARERMTARTKLAEIRRALKEDK